MKFPVLSFVSLLLLIVGWPLVLAGSYFGIWEGVIEPNLPNHRFANEDIFQLGGGMLALVFGLVLVAIGEVIKVFLAIEKNTRTASSKSSVHIPIAVGGLGPSGEAA